MWQPLCLHLVMVRHVEKCIALTECFKVVFKGFRSVFFWIKEFAWAVFEVQNSHKLPVGGNNTHGFEQPHSISG